MIFALYEHPGGVETQAGARIVYELEPNQAYFGAASTTGHALVWELHGSENGLVTLCRKGEAALAVEVELDPATEWVARCDRVDFPPGGIAYRHVHPGPGIRRLLFGELTIEAEDGPRTHGPGAAWFEGAGFPVRATASPSEDTAFVRVMLIPAEWAGKRTIRYLDPADEDKPKLQHAEVLLEEPLRR